MPALMTPCFPDRTVNYEALVRKACELIDVGMRAVVYCGSMGDWPLLTNQQRQEGVRRLVEAGVPVVVGTGAQNSRLAAEHAAHAKAVGAAGLMLIPHFWSCRFFQYASIIASPSKSVPLVPKCCRA